MDAVDSAVGRRPIRRRDGKRLDTDSLGRASFRTLAVVVMFVALFTTMAIGRSPAARAAAVAPFGIASVATLVGGPRAAYDTEAQAIRRTGATWIRILVSWNLLEPERGDFRWGAFDSAVTAASSAGLRILLVIEGPAPVWAQAEGSDPLANFTPPADPATFGTVAGTIARRYQSSVSTWEIWNEPNLPHYFQPLDVARYAAILKAAYANIHAVQPGATVISGGLSTVFGDGIDPVGFVRQLYDSGAGASFDAIALHPYTFPYRLTEDPAGRGNAIQETHQLMAERGQAGKKIWITEYGQATGTSDGAVSAARQAEIIADFLRQVSAIGYLGPSFLFTSRDLGDDPANHDFNYGLYTVDYQPKPVVGVIQSLAG